MLISSSCEGFRTIAISTLFTVTSMRKIGVEYFFSEMGCIFCRTSVGELQMLTKKGLEWIYRASIARRDGLNEKLSLHRLSEYRIHSGCIRAYIDKRNIAQCCQGLVRDHTYTRHAEQGPVCADRTVPSANDDCDISGTPVARNETSNDQSIVNVSVVNENVSTAAPNSEGMTMSAPQGEYCILFVLYQL